MKYIAPAGTVMSLGEIAAGVSRGLFNRSASEASLNAEIRRQSGLEFCWPVSSARAGMTLALQAMREAAKDAQRDEVIIPAYTCYSVPASIQRAGLRPRLCDVDPETFGMDPEALDRSDFRRVLAVVSANLYGLPNALGPIEAIARKRGVYLLDDAAQALGARLSDRAVGSFGDVGLYSFDKGKIICTIQGGAIVARESALRNSLESILGSLEPSAFAESLMNIAKLPIYALCLRPALYDIVRRLPGLGLGKTAYETRYPISWLGAGQVGVASKLAPRIDALNSGRRRVAAKLTATLNELPNLKLARIASEATPVYARFPIRIASTELRDQCVAMLDSAGIGATTSYPRALSDVPEVAAMLRSPSDPMPGARTVAAQIMTLPTHGYCPPDFDRRVYQVLAKALDSRTVSLQETVA